MIDNNQKRDLSTSKLDHNSKETENLFLDDLHIISDLGKDRRFDKIISLVTMTFASLTDYSML